VAVIFSAPSNSGARRSPPSGNPTFTSHGRARSRHS
jgi:hypothetical protein